MKYLLFLFLSCNIPFKKPKHNNRDQSFQRINKDEIDPIKKNANNESQYIPTLYSLDAYLNMIIDKNLKSKSEEYLTKKKEYVKNIVDNYIEFNKYTEENLKNSGSFPEIIPYNVNDNDNNLKIFFEELFKEGRDKYIDKKDNLIEYHSGKPLDFININKLMDSLDNNSLQKIKEPQDFS